MHHVEPATYNPPPHPYADYWTSPTENPMFRIIPGNNSFKGPAETPKVPPGYHRIFVINTQNVKHMAWVEKEASADIQAQLSAIKKRRPELQVEVQLNPPEWNASQVKMSAQYYIINIDNMQLRELTTWGNIKRWWRKQQPFYSIDCNRDDSSIKMYSDGHELYFIHRQSPHDDLMLTGLRNLQWKN